MSTLDFRAFSNQFQAILEPFQIVFASVFPPIFGVVIVVIVIFIFTVIAAAIVAALSSFFGFVFPLWSMQCSIDGHCAWQAPWNGSTITKYPCIWTKTLQRYQISSQPRRQRQELQKWIDSVSDSDSEYFSPLLKPPKRRITNTLTIPTL